MYSTITTTLTYFAYAILSTRVVWISIYIYIYIYICIHYYLLASSNSMNRRLVKIVNPASNISSKRGK